MRSATPAVTVYVHDDPARPRGCADGSADPGRPRPAAGRTRRPASGAAARSVSYSSSPLLASKTPPWRSKFLVRWSDWASACCSAARCYIQIIGNQFYLDQGEKRYAHDARVAGQPRPHHRPQRCAAGDLACRCRRSGPFRKTCRPRPQQKRQLAKLLGVPPRELDEQARPTRTRTSRGCSARSTSRCGSRCRRSASRASTRSASTAASTPRASRRRTWWASPTSRTSGQEGIELAFQKELQGRDGSRIVVKDRLGRVVEDIGDQVDPVDGRDIAARGRRQGAVLRLPARARRGGRAQGQGRQRGGARRADRRGAGAGQLPELQPGRAPQPDAARSCATAR